MSEAGKPVGRKIPIVATIIVLVAVGIMIRLGFWQLDRLAEKEAMIAEYESNAQLPAIENPDYADEALLVFRNVRINCDQPTDWNAIAGRNDRDQTGYVHHFTCRSAIPFGGLHGDVYQPALRAAIGWSAGPGQPEFSGGVMEGLLVRAGDDYKIVSNTPLAGLEANATPDPANLPNNHLAYAGQWFFFAITALVIYILALRPRWRMFQSGEQG